MESSGSPSRATALIPLIYSGSEELQSLLSYIRYNSLGMKRPPRKKQAAMAYKARLCNEGCLSGQSASEDEVSKMHLDWKHIILAMVTGTRPSGYWYGTSHRVSIHWWIAKTERGQAPTISPA